MSTLVYPTMLDIVKMRGNDPTIGLVEEVVNEIPELRVIAARPIKGTSFKSLVRTALPVVSFRSVNQGAVQGKSAYDQRTFECFPMNPRWNADKMMADAHEDGAAVYIATEGSLWRETSTVLWPKLATSKEHSSENPVLHES